MSLALSMPNEKHNSHGDDEDPRAYVTLREGAHTTEQDIINFVQDRVSKLKRLTGGVVFTDTIPKNPVSQMSAKKCKIIMSLLARFANAEDSSQVRFFGDSCATWRAKTS